eukprot:2262730-Amphidinium_carterae.1
MEELKEHFVTLIWPQTISAMAMREPLETTPASIGISITTLAMRNQFLLTESFPTVAVLV